MFNLPSFFSGGDGVNNPSNIESAKGSGFGDLLAGANFGTTLQEAGSIIGGIGSWLGMEKQADYQDKMLGMEEDRVKEEKAKQKKFDDGMAKSFA